MDPIADRMSPETRKEWQDLKDSGYARLMLAHEIYMQHIHGEEPHVQDRDDARRNEGVQTSSGQP
jgi:hypothetical protein